MSMSLAHVGWLIVLAYLIAVVGTTIHLWNRKQLAEPENLLLLFMLYDVLLVTFVGNLMDIGENNRFRFVIDPYLLFLLIFVVKRAGAKRDRSDPPWEKT